MSRVVLIPLTSNTEKLYPGEAYVTLNGNKSKAMDDQLMAADKARLKSQIGSITQHDLLTIEDAIKLHLSFQN